MMHDRTPHHQKLTANVKSAGCAAKISPSELNQIVRSLSRLDCPELLTGFENFEDAAVYQLSDKLALVQTVDFFPPPVDDPYLFGRIAAVNALSDIYAMGGRPILALNVFCFPTCDYPLSVAQQILAGGADAIAEAGAVLAGGHSIQSPEPIYGLAVTGLVDPSAVLTNGGARPGDRMVLCKAIGTGVGLLGLKGDVLSESARDALLKNLTTLNNASLEIARNYDLHAATDITGFGLIGHVHEMAKASGLTAVIWPARVPFLPETRELAGEGFVPAGAYGNRNAYLPFVSSSESYIKESGEAVESVMDLLFDPQTAGGLLFALGAEAALELTAALTAGGIRASIVGRFRDGSPGSVEVGADEEKS